MAPIDRDIQSISFGRACRDKLGMYLHADRAEALELGLREIYVNSFDALTETKQKDGEVLIALNSKERTIQVIDNGPGIPDNKRDDGVSALVAAFTLPHTGSHFDGREVNSIGTHGIGGSVVNHTSSKFEVITYHGGTMRSVGFEGSPEGAVIRHCSPATKVKPAEGRGTSVQYTPDSAVYGDEWLNIERIIATLDEMMRFYPNIKVTLRHDGEVKTFHYPRGLKTAETRVYYESDNLIIALGIGSDSIRPFGNRLYLPQGGAFFTHFKTQMTRVVNDLSGLKLTGAQIQAVFQGYCAVFVSNPLFSNQSKTAISNKEVNNEITLAVKAEITKFSKTAEWEKVMKELETELRAEEAAEKARQKIRKAMDEISKGARKKVVAADKLKDCIQSGENAWLAICEGLSAKGSLALGRDVNTVALFDIRGKFINAMKNKKENYLDNEELVQICQILGCGIFEKYNARNLRYGKVLIATDADEDGKNIADLLITFFYVCMPKFIQEGRLYWMRTPLYYNDKQFIFTQEEWAKVRNKKGFTRAKGLGELSPNAVEQALFGKDKRWEQLKPQNWNGFSKLIEMLMGPEVEERREFIFNNVDFEKITFL